MYVIFDRADGITRFWLYLHLGKLKKFFSVSKSEMSYFYMTIEWLEKKYETSHE